MKREKHKNRQIRAEWRRRRNNEIREYFERRFNEGIRYELVEEEIMQRWGLAPGTIYQIIKNYGFYKD